MKIQLSLSTKCNLHCKFCLTEVMKNKFNFVENLNMEIETVYKVLNHKIEYLSICSNRGEALFHPEIEAILIYAKERDNGIDFSTNAFHKPKKWWKWLGDLFDYRDVITFPLDGIGNKTHNMYRGSDFYTVLSNIEAYLESGNRAIWRFIKFEHNQHQVELARKFANELGIEFQVINSHTYDNVLRKPDSKVWTKENIRSEKATNNDYLPCEDKNYYVNVKGYVFPCCFMANIFGNKPLRNGCHDKILLGLFNKERELLNINNHKIEEIAEKSEFYKEAMKKYSNICKEACLKWTRNTK